jgi:hypothetical protein
MRSVFGSVSAFLPQMLLVSVLVGCGGRGDGYSGPRGTVSGTVTVDGKPLQKGCQVIFIASVGHTAAGVIDEAGKYTLVYSDGDVPAVEYQVQLTSPISTATQQADPAEMAQKMKLSAKAGGAANEAPFPAKYGSTSSSTMSFTVKEGPNTADFALSGK